MLGLVRKSELDACNKVRLKVEAALLESESENSRLTDVIRRQSDEVDHLRSKLQELKGHPCFTSYRDLELINQEVEKQKAWMQERVLKYQSSLEDLNDEIAACKDELAEKRTSLEFFDEMEDVSGLVKKLYGPGADATKKKIEAVHEDLKAYIRSERAWSFSGKLTFDESTTKGRAVQKRTAKFMLAAFNAEASHLIAKSTASNFTQTIRKIENWFDRVNKFGKDDMCILERDLLTLRLEEHRLTFEHLMRAEFEKDE